MKKKIFCNITSDIYLKYHLLLQVLFIVPKRFVIIVYRYLKLAEMQLRFANQVAEYII